MPRAKRPRKAKSAPKPKKKEPAKDRRWLVWAIFAVLSVISTAFRLWGKRRPSRKKRAWILIVSVFVCQLAGIVGSLFTAPAISTWYAGLIKPWFTPPGWLFGPVWITLYTLMGISLFLVLDRRPLIALGFKKKKEDAIQIFGIQLILNAIWSILFFGLRNPGIAFAEIVLLWAAILVTIVKFRKISRKAAWIMVPYIVWVSIAAALNLAVWVLN